MAKLKIYLVRAMDGLEIEEIQEIDNKFIRHVDKNEFEFLNLYIPTKGDPVQDAYEIAEKDIQLLKLSDLVIADLSISNYQYVGAIFELTYARIWDIPIVLIVGNSGYEKRIFLQAYCDFIAYNELDALDFIHRAYIFGGIKKQMSEMQSYYNEIASKYMDKSVRTHKTPGNKAIEHQNERAQLREVLKTYVHGATCQFGIGTGDWTKTVCECSERVLGVEQSSNMLCRAEESLSQFSNVKFQQIDLLEQNINSGSFDCVVIYFLLSILPKSMQEIIFRRVKDIINKDGVLIIADTKKIGDVDAIGLGRIQLQTRQSNNKKFIIYKEHFTGDILKKIIEKSGFKVVNYSKDSIWFSWVVAHI